jgi:hypothetical protein
MTGHDARGHLDPGAVVFDRASSARGIDRRSWLPRLTCCFVVGPAGLEPTTPSL